MSRPHRPLSIRHLICMGALIASACVPQSRSRDVDGNGWIEAADVAIVESCLGLAATVSAFCRAADIDRDGVLGADDVAAVEAQVGTLLFNTYISGEADRVAVSDQVLYAFNYSDAYQVNRWDLEQGRWLAPIAVPSSLSDLAIWDDQGRTLASTYSGTIFEIDPQLGTLGLFAIETGPVEAIQPLGSLLVVVVRESGQLPKLRVRDSNAVVQSELVVDSVPLRLTWSESEGRLYWLGPYDVQWVELNLETGQLGAVGSHPWNPAALYHPTAVIPSLDGTVHSVSGRFIYRSADGTLVDQLNLWAWDQIWTDAGQLVSLIESTNPNGTLLVLSDPLDFETVDVAFYPGAPIRIRRDALGIAVVTRTSSSPGAFERFRYTPGVDGDGDGIPYDLDDVPFDGSASADTDHDGAPDAWNPGSGPEQSVTGLELDAFPLDTACQRPEHALDLDPSRCDYAKEVPNVVDPDARFVDVRGIVHLLDKDRERIFRWSVDGQEYVDSIRVRKDTRDMTYAAPLDRIYTHTRTEVQSLDAGASHPKQVELFWTGEWIEAVLAQGDPFEAVGPYLYYYEDATGGVVLGPDGAVLDSGQPPNGTTPPFDPAHLRVFQGSAWIAIEPTWGTFVGYPRTPEPGPTHGLGADAFLNHAGEIRAVPGFAHLGTISSRADGVAWLPDGTLATLEKNQALRTTRFERWDTAGQLLDLVVLPGVADDLVVVDPSRVVVLSVTNRTELLVVPIDDGGGGSPLDSAAHTGPPSN